MFKLKVSSSFSAAHSLKNYQGKCENLHGHNWKVELIVSGDKLNQTYILIDFKELKNILNLVLSELDHTNLNEHPYFSNTNPSSEKIAQYIFEKVKTLLKKYPNVKVEEVLVYETENSCAIYKE